jgi:hypothetical protein
MKADHKGTSMAVPPHEEGVVKLPRVTIDLKVPLWSLVTVAAIGLTGIIGMYYKLDQVGGKVIELEATQRVVNSEIIKFAREQAVLEFRVNKLEQGR